MRQLLGLGLPRLANIEQKIEVFVRKDELIALTNYDNSSKKHN